MSKDLPKMYQNNFGKEINNNRCVFNSMIDKREDIINSQEDVKLDRFMIEQKIFNIFNSKNYIYKADVTIVTDTQTFKKRIVGKNSGNLITIDNEYIPISIIRDIYRS